MGAQSSGSPNTAEFRLFAAPFPAPAAQDVTAVPRVTHGHGVGEVTLSCAWWSLPVPGADACEKQIYFCLRFIFFTLHGVRQRISSSIESEE